ncbi:MAG: hypothetical protein WBG92_02225 [Thiohalocapsa sp.]
MTTQTLPRWRQTAAGIWSDDERRAILRDLDLPPWLLDDVANAARDLFTFLHGRDDARFKPELVRIACDERLREVWPQLFAANSPNAPLRGERARYEFARAAASNGF